LAVYIIESVMHGHTSTKRKVFVTAPNDFLQYQLMQLKSVCIKYFSAWK